MEALDAEQQQQLQQQEWPEGASSSCRYAPTRRSPRPDQSSNSCRRTAVAKKIQRATAMHGDRPALPPRSRPTVVPLSYLIWTASPVADSRRPEWGVEEFSVPGPSEFHLTFAFDPPTKQPIPPHQACPTRTTAMRRPRSTRQRQQQQMMMMMGRGPAADDAADAAGATAAGAQQQGQEGQGGEEGATSSR